MLNYFYAIHFALIHSQYRCYTDVIYTHCGEKNNNSSLWKTSQLPACLFSEVSTLGLTHGLRQSSNKTCEWVYNWQVDWQTNFKEALNRFYKQLSKHQLYSRFRCKMFIVIYTVRMQPPSLTANTHCTIKITIVEENAVKIVRNLLKIIFIFSGPPSGLSALVALTLCWRQLLLADLLIVMLHT